LRRHVGKLQLLDDRVALVHGEEVVAGLDHLIDALVEERAQALAATLRDSSRKIGRQHAIVCCAPSSASSSMPWTSSLIRSTRDSAMASIEIFWIATVLPAE
jgi:pantothenate kinase